MKIPLTGLFMIKMVAYDAFGDKCAETPPKFVRAASKTEIRNILPDLPAKCYYEVEEVTIEPLTDVHFTDKDLIYLDT